MDPAWRGVGHSSLILTTSAGKETPVQVKNHGDSTARYSQVPAGTSAKPAGQSSSGRRPGRSAGAIPGGAGPRAHGHGKGWPAGPHSCQEKSLPCPTRTQEPPCAAPCLSTRCRVTHRRKDALITLTEPGFERVSLCPRLASASAKVARCCKASQVLQPQQLRRETRLRRKTKPGFNPAASDLPQPRRYF